MRNASATVFMIVLTACSNSAALEQRIAELEGQLTATTESNTPSDDATDPDISADDASKSEPNTTSSTAPTTSTPKPVYATDLREHPIEISLEEASRRFRLIRFNGAFPGELNGTKVDTEWGRRYRAGFNQAVFCDGTGTWSSMAADLDIDWSLTWESRGSEAVLMGFESINGSLSLMEWFGEHLNCDTRINTITHRNRVGPCASSVFTYCAKFVQDDDLFDFDGEATVDVTGFVNPDDNGFRILQGTQIEFERAWDRDFALQIDRGDVFVVKRLGNLVLLTHTFGWCCEKWTGQKPDLSSDLDVPLPDFDDLLARTDSLFQEITNIVFSEDLLPPSPTSVSVEVLCGVLQAVSLKNQDFSRVALRKALTDGPTMGDLATGARSLLRLETQGLQGRRLSEAISLLDLAYCPAP